MTDESHIFAEVITRIWSKSEIWDDDEAQIYRNGERIRNSTEGPKVAAEALYYAVNPEQSDRISSVLNIWLEVDSLSDLLMRPPQEIQSKYTICDPEGSEIAFKHGVNATPSGSFVDLHCGENNSRFLFSNTC